HMGGVALGIAHVGPLHHPTEGKVVADLAAVGLLAEHALPELADVLLLDGLERLHERGLELAVGLLLHRGIDEVANAAEDQHSDNYHWSLRRLLPGERSTRVEARSRGIGTEGVRLCARGRVRGCIWGWARVL